MSAGEGVNSTRRLEALNLPPALLDLRTYSNALPLSVEEARLCRQLPSPTPAN